MVAIFTGLGSGFERGSGAALGGVGLLGGGSLGRGGEHVSVNAANGNLLLSRQDEFLVGRGQDVGISRTYNSRGALDDNGDHWRQSTDRRVFDYVAGVSVKRVSADGSEITYSHVSGTTYKSTDGSGTHDTLTYSGSDWTWKDGNSQVTEKYETFGTDNWHITEQKDTDGNNVAFAYTSGGKLSTITTADGGYLKYTRSGNNISSIETYADGGATKTLTRTRYTYDSSNRLETVTTDLSPEDSSVSDSNKYVTTYTYHGSTNHIASITQTDGSHMDILYDSSDRVISLKQTATTGDIRETTLTYSSSGHTSIYDPSGVQTTLYHDANELLTRIQTLTPGENGGEINNYFTYDASGNVKSIQDAEGQTTLFNYDANGNVTESIDAAGNSIYNKYDVQSNLIRKYYYATPNTAAATSSDWVLEHFVYDSESHLRYSIDGEGRVSEFKYDATGNHTYTHQFTNDKYVYGWTPPTEAQVTAWRNGLADKTQVDISNNFYDAKGQIVRSVNYGASNTSGVETTAEGYTDALFIYDSAGRLLSRKTTVSDAETYIYDGLGRLTASTDINGGTTSIVFNDAATKTTITSAGGHVTVNTFNKAGNLISKLDSGTFDTTGTSTYKYDKNGRLQMVTDATGYKSYFVYDQAGRKTANVDHYGNLVEYGYDKNGRQISSVRYASSVNNSHLNTLGTDPDNALGVSDLRPALNPDDIHQWTGYNTKGQVSHTALGDGSVTTYTYDKAGQLISTYSYVNTLNSSQITALKAGGHLSSLTMPTVDTVKDIVIRTFYDRSGRVVGTLDGEGHLSAITYDKAGQVISQMAYANPTPASYRAAYSFDAILAAIPKDATYDVTVRNVYDGQGSLRFSIDALGKVTEYQYGTSENAIGLVRSTIQHTETLQPLGDYKLSTVKAAVAALGTTSTNRKGWAVYNTQQQLAYSIDSVGGVAKFEYDNQGNVISTTQFATVRSTVSLPTDATMDAWAAANRADARITRNYYSSGGLLRYVVDAEGFVTGTDYDQEGRVYSEYSWADKISTSNSASISTVDAANKGAVVSTQYRYDSAGRLESVEDAKGVRTSFGYHATGLKSWEIRDYGGTSEARIKSVFDAAGRKQIEYIYSGSTSTEKYSNTNFYYDGLGNLSHIQNQKGTHSGSTADQNTYFTYDKSGQVLTRTDAENNVSSYQYDAFGGVTQVTDALGNQTNNIYDKGGRLTRSTDALWQQTNTAYTAFGEVFTVERNSATTTFVYDKLGRNTDVTDALGQSESFIYNAFSQQTQITNKLGGTTHNTFDKRGQLISQKVMGDVHNNIGVKIADFSTTDFTYDSRGNRTTMTEAANLTAAEQRTTTYIFNSINQLIEKQSDSISVYSSGTESTSNTEVPSEFYDYDSRGNLIESKNANDARTLYYYDRLDRVTDQVSPEGTLAHNEYDFTGNLVETKVYASKITLPASAVGTPPVAVNPSDFRQTTFAYDKLGRVTDSYVHDVQTAKFGTSLTITAANNTLQTQYLYDAVGNVTKVIDPNGIEVISEYDVLGRKTRKIDGGGFITDWEYNADGNVTKETRQGSGTDAARITEFTYDLNGRRTSETRKDVQVHNNNGGHVTSDSAISYLYNALGQVTTKTEATGDQIVYTYDNAGRLTHETRSGYQDHTDNTVTPKVQYFYNGLNDLAQTYKYGANGAVAADSHYTYAKGGRLTSVEDANGFTRTYRYNVTGQLVREEYVRVAADGSSTTEGIGYDYDDEGRVIAQGAVVEVGGTWSRGGNALDTINTKYNAFGNVSERGINGKYSEILEYDNAGRLWKTTSGDGAYKYFMYDENGNQSLVVTSDGTDIDDKTITEILALWGVSSSGGSANDIYTNYVDGITATITKYDDRNQAIEVHEPEREYHAAGVKTQADFLTKRSYNGFGEVISETDTLNNTIDYAYNTMGRRIKVESPTVSVTDESGNKTNVRPTEEYYYDVSGRLVASRDANGNLTSQTLLAGTGYSGTQALITETTAADGGRITTAYDIFGNARKVTSQLGHTSAGVVDEALGYTTVNSFDDLGRVTQIAHAGGLIDNYAYDGLGQQTQHWNNQLTTSLYTGSGPVWINTPPPPPNNNNELEPEYDPLTGGPYGYWYFDPADFTNVPEIQTTSYDAQGRVIQQVGFGGDTTSTAYVWNGALATSGMGVFGGWEQTTTTANGKIQTTHKDVFGHETFSNDLGSNITTTTYNKAGRVTGRTGTGTDTQSYTYLNTGKLDALTISGTNYASSYLTVNNFSRTSSYQYDKVGNLLGESLTEASTIAYTYQAYYNGQTYNGGTYTTTAVLQNSTASYDALGRLTAWTEAGSGVGTPPASKLFEYDAQGNIRRTQSTFKSLDAQGVASATNTVKDTWYRFDSMNRVVTSEGQLIPGGIITRGTGVDIYYDKAGQRAYTLQDTVTTIPNSYTGVIFGVSRENYSYNKSGQVTGIDVSTGNLITPPPAVGTLRSTFVYDLLGRQTSQTDYEADGTTVAYSSVKAYNLKSQLVSDTANAKRPDGSYKTITSYSYGAGATYANGAAVSISTRSYAVNSATVSTLSLTTNTYAWKAGAVQSATTYNPNTTQSTTHTTTYTNSKSGALLSARIQDGRARTVTFVNDNYGQVIRRDEKDALTGGDPHEVWYRFGGKEMGYTGNNDTNNTDHQSSITDRTVALPTGTNANTGAFKNGSTYSVAHDDFDGAYSAINSYKQGSIGGSYTVRGGETLSSLAQSLYGDSGLWYKIAQANGLTAETPLIQGQSLILPSGVVKSVHNANSIKPFDPSEARGDLSPTTPEPPKESSGKGGKCGVFGKILLVVVAVVVSLATFNPATGTGVLAAFSASAAGGLGLGVAGTAIATTVIGGALAGAVGSIASQVVGVATGIQDKFSWKGVALAAIGGGIGGGVVGKFGSGAAVTNLQTFGAAAVRGAAINVAIQGIGVATGLQDSFSWAGVAAAGIGAGIGGFVGNQVAGEVGSRFTQKLVTSSASAIANAATRSAIEGSNFGDNIIAAIPDVIGGAIGGYIGGEINAAFDSVIKPPTVAIASGSYTLPDATPSQGSLYGYTTGVTYNVDGIIVHGKQTRNFDEVVYAANAHRWSQQSASRSAQRQIDTELNYIRGVGYLNAQIDQNLALQAHAGDLRDSFNAGNNDPFSEFDVVDFYNGDKAEIERINRSVDYGRKSSPKGWRLSEVASIPYYIVHAIGDGADGLKAGSWVGEAYNTANFVDNWRQLNAATIGTLAPEDVKLRSLSTFDGSRVVKTIKGAGRIGGGLAFFSDSFDGYQEYNIRVANGDDTWDTGVEIGGGVIGSTAGGYVGAVATAGAFSAGAALAFSWTGPGALVAGAVGGVVGGFVGSKAGKWTGRAIGRGINYLKNDVSYNVRYIPTDRLPTPYELKLQDHGF